MKKMIRIALALVLALSVLISSALAQEVIDEMVYWDFATEQDGMIILNPTTSLWQGVYPNNRRNNHG